MKVKELIARLVSVVEEHGDIVVTVSDEGCGYSFEPKEVYVGRSSTDGIKMGEKKCYIS